MTVDAKLMEPAKSSSEKLQPENDNHDDYESFDKLLHTSLSILQILPATSIDFKLSGRLIRVAAIMRSRFNKQIFLNFLNKMTDENDVKSLIIDILQQLPSSEELEENKIDNTLFGDNSVSCNENLYLFLSLITLTAVIDCKCPDIATSLIKKLLLDLDSFSTCPKHDELLISKIIYYVGCILELNHILPDYIEYLFHFYRTAVRYNHKIMQAVTINTILRIYVQTHQFEQAVKFLSKIKFPEKLRSNAQQARYLYYLGRILVVRLNYMEGNAKLTQALRRAPHGDSVSGRGFRLAASKLLCLTQLLLGEISDRLLFVQKGIRKGLEPYSQIVRAVISGDLNHFNRVMEKYQAVFETDRNFILVQRLHQNVIRSGLQKIAASYLRISFDDVAMKLGLQQTDDTECIISKAIADGVINATVCSETRTMTTKVSENTQTLLEPLKQLQTRIGFCTQLYNDFLKAMQYPEADNDVRTDEIEARRKEHQKKLENVDSKDAEEVDDSNLY